jgi:ribose/xylose/arabinose/galactoside ABC-type transport system permease subunit
MSEIVKRKRIPLPAGIGARGLDPLGFLDKFGAFTFLIVLVLLFSASSQEFRDSFFNPLNLFNVMRQVSITGLIAIGMTFVILTGGIDLSVGSLLALSGMVAAAVYKGGTGLLDTRAEQTSGVGVGVAIAVACLVGLSGGLIQGWAITKLKVPPFIVTLGGLSAFRGLALLLAGGGPISAFDSNFTWWGKGKLFDQIPIPVIIFLGLALLAFIILRYTQYGRYIYAVGGNPEAARLSGLNTTLLILSVYMIVGFLAGLGGFVQAARVNSAEQVAGLGYELTVIAAVVIGGTSLFGGEGGVLGTVIGSVFIGVLQNGLQLMNVQSYTQQIIIGVIVVLAVFIDRVIKSRRR